MILQALRVPTRPALTHVSNPNSSLGNSAFRRGSGRNEWYRNLRRRELGASQDRKHWYRQTVSWFVHLPARLAVRIVSPWRLTLCAPVLLAVVRPALAGGLLGSRLGAPAHAAKAASAWSSGRDHALALLPHLGRAVREAVRAQLRGHAGTKAGAGTVARLRRNRPLAQ